jgi:uncharacterized RDD family membrane protein YckC
MARDPTQVVTRRCLAFLVDAPVVVVLVAFSAFVTPGAFDVDGDCPVPAPGGEFCVQWKEDAYRIDGRSFLLFAAVLVALLVLVLGVTKRRTGASPGKALFGIRVVDATGEHAGFWRGALRTAALVVDVFTLLLPIGLWLVLFTPGHRRIGDFLARTWVVRASAVGMPPPRRYPRSADHSAATKNGE